MREVLSQASETFSLQVFDGGEFRRMVDHALTATKRWQKRQRLLRAPLMLWTVVAMSLFRSLSISNVFLKILDAMRGDLDVKVKAVTNEAVYKARGRLGWEPLRLFALSLPQLQSPAATFFGFVPVAIDGVRMDVPDSPLNRVGFGVLPESRGPCAFPQLSGAMLIYTDTRLIIDAVWGAWHMSELTVVPMLLDNLGPQHVLFLDRRYTKVELWLDLLLERHIHFVHRVSKAYDTSPLRPLGPGDWIIDVQGHELRLIEYRVGDNEVVQIITDLTDPIKYPARELALGYHARWEIELAYDEAKTHLSSVLHGTLHTVFRSKTPAGVIQEAWGLVAAYNLLRGLMVEAGQTYNIPPLEISFVDTLEVVRNAMPRMQSTTPAKRPVLYRRMIRDIADCRLDRPRRKRVVARVVKRKMSNFKLKRPGDRSLHRDFAAELVLVE
jgi:hypothetical protein